MQSNEDKDNQRTNKHQRYNRSEKGRARYERYRVTSKGLLNEERQYQTRYRGGLSAE